MTMAAIRTPPRLHNQRMTSTVLRNEAIARRNSWPATPSRVTAAWNLARVNLLAVTEGYRRRRAGTALMEAAEEWGRTGEWSQR
ncbi:GNAT family N-acetyltransferase [Actinoallomurus bryophytorum]